MREALSAQPKVVEKKMFRGITFMVDGKMCVSAGGDELMCRIDPDLYDTAVKKPGCRAMVLGGRTMKGFLYVKESAMKDKSGLDYWIDLALEFNKKAKRSKRKG